MFSRHSRIASLVVVKNNDLAKVTATFLSPIESVNRA
jgi:hypothetical protein